MELLSALKSTVEYCFFYWMDYVDNRNHIDKVLDHLYIGNIYAALNSDILRENNINVVINCSTDIPFADDENIKTYRLAVEDDKSSCQIRVMSDSLDKFVQIIKQQIDNGENVLVHCRAGVQRSASLVVAYLMKYRQMDLDTAKLFIRNCRHCVFRPEMNFIESLMQFESKK